MTTKLDKGRPNTRNRESFMLAIWRAVQEEIHVRGAKSIRQACEKIYYGRANKLIKFVDESGKVIDLINNADCGANTLRQRYQTAERCRHDAERYPSLHHTAQKLLKILPGSLQRIKAAKAEKKRREETGDWLT